MFKNVSHLIWREDTHTQFSDTTLQTLTNRNRVQTNDPDSSTGVKIKSTIVYFIPEAAFYRCFQLHVDRSVFFETIVLGEKDGTNNILEVRNNKTMVENRISVGARYNLRRKKNKIKTGGKYKSKRS